MTEDRIRPSYWFKPRMFGYGATPVTWQGWALTIGYAVAVVLLANHLGRTHPLYLWLLLPITLALLWVSWAKTDGGWRWRWGR